MKHDDIVLQITDKKLVSLLSKVFDKQDCWSRFHWIVKKNIEEWNISEINSLMNHLPKGTEEIKLKIIKENFTKACKFIEELSKENSLIIEKTFEFPLVKGEGVYKITKGFIDLIVHCDSVKALFFSSYNNSCPIEFIIEIKKEEDFNDFGSILRQIKEYREYYDGMGIKKWINKIIPKNEKIGEWDDKENKYITKVNRIYCILSTKITDEVKKLFSNEQILCLELDSLNDIQQKELM